MRNPRLEFTIAFAPPILSERREVAVNCRMLVLPALLLLCAATAHAQNQRDIAVRQDRQKLDDDESWFYDDLETALAAAAKANRPLMVVFR